MARKEQKDIKERVYIAGPYTDPEQEENTWKAIGVANQVAEMGFIPFVPHLTYYFHQLIPHEYEFWMEQDEEWLKVCQKLVRIPGKSSGADKEMALAKELGIEVYGLIEFFEKYGKKGL